MVSSSSDDEATWTLSAYCGCSTCNGNSDCISASGRKLKDADAYRVCAAPKSIPMGTVLTVTGGWNGTLTVVDRGGAIKGHKIDVFIGVNNH